MSSSRLARLIPRRRSHRILAGVAALLLFVYALAGFYVVPRVARTQVEAFVAETLHRKIVIGDIAFNPFTLAVTITDLKLTEADGAPLIAFRRLYVNAEIASLWRGVVLKEIELVAPDVEIIVAPDGSLNLAALAPPPDPAPAQPKRDSKPVHLEIGRFALAGGRVGFQDRSQAPAFSAAFTPIRFSLTDFSTDVGHSNAYSFVTASRLGAKLEWNGAFTVQPLGSTGTFSLSDVRLAAVDEYLKHLPLEVVSGSLELRGSYRFALQPLTLHVVLPALGVRDLVVAERGVAGSPPVTVPQVDVKDLVFSLSRRDVGLRRLDVRGARVDVVREKDGSLNLMRLAPAPSQPSSETAKPAKSQAAPWTVHAEAIGIEAAMVTAEDRTTSPPFQMKLSPIEISVGGWTTAPNARVKIDAQAGIDGKGRLGVGGELRLEPLGAALAINLQRFPLPALQPYLAQSTGLALHSGNLSIKGSLALAPGRAGAPPAAKVAADVKIDDVRATDDLVKEDLLKWRSLAITGIRFQQRPDRLAIDRVLAQEPYARVIVAQNGTTNISRALAPPAGAEPAAKAPSPKPQAGTAGPPMPITIRSVQVADGSANFADYSVQPSFATGIVGLHGEIAGLSSDRASRAKVGFAGQVDQYSPVEISGEVNVLSADVYTDLAMKFSNIELTTFNPYSGKFAGYNIAKGKLSTAMQYRVEDRKLNAQHHIVVDNLEFGDKTDSKDAAPIPVQLGVALLKDRRGVIEVDLPIDGTLDDPQFHLAAIIGKAILNLLAKVIAAPFKAIGAMFGGGDELAHVDFQPGSAALADAQAKKLGTLSKALVERPQLRLDVPLMIVVAADGEAMAGQALAKLVPPTDSKAKRIEALEVAYRARLKSAPEYPKELLGDEAPKVDARVAWLEAALLENLKPAPDALDALGRQRAGAVRDALLANKELKPERVFIVAKSKEVASPPGAVRMEMGLQ